jgi:starch-binding outer membrane protein, SusD/RagB family
MTDSMDHAALAARRTAAVLAAATGLLLGGCSQSDLLTVPTPDIVLPGDISSAAALPNAFAAALGDFQVAYAGDGGGTAPFGSTEGLVIYSGMLADEFLNAETFPTRLEVDERRTNPVNSSTLPIFQLAERARASAELVTDRYIALDPTNPQRSETQALAGFMYVLFAEDYCNGVPTSVVNPDGTFSYGDPQTGAQLLDHAIAKFDSAITVATAAGAAGESALELARIGKGRALLDKNDPVAAAAAVAAVPSSYAYDIESSENTTRQQNGINNYTFQVQRFTVANREGGNGIPFVTLNDPRVPVVLNGVGFDNGTPFYLTFKFQELKSPTPLALGVEARLIEAEAALRAGNDASFLADLNDARANARTYAELTSPPTAPPAAPAALTLADLPTTAVGKQDLLFQERALALFGTSHRLGDLRRLIRQYRRDAESVFPTGDYNPLGAAAGTLYGTDVNLPVPFEETNNPKYSGCLDRAP